MAQEMTNGRFPPRNQLRRTVQTLADMLTLLFPQPHSLDIITYKDIQKRYPLTEMRGPAVVALEQSRRILRAVGDYQQMGLCTFHHGLCYLYWDDCSSAREQFEEARRQWAFVNIPSAISLAYFAMARTRHHLHQDEAAMMLYGRAEQWQQRIHLLPTSKQEKEFVARLLAELHSAQEGLRERMWPKEQRGSLLEGGDKTADFPTQETAVSEPQEVDSEAPTQDSVTVPPPTLNMGRKNFVPMPGHEIEESRRYEWYRVVERQKDDTFPDEIRESSWLLVDRDVQAHPLDEQKLLVVQVDDGRGSVVLRPQKPIKPFQRIYLANVQSQKTFSFDRDVVTGEIELSHDTQLQKLSGSNMLGVVIGYWMSYSMQDA